MSQNEWKTTEIRAWQSRTFLTLFLPRFVIYEVTLVSKGAPDSKDVAPSGPLALISKPAKATVNAEKLDVFHTGRAKVELLPTVHENPRD